MIYYFNAITEEKLPFLFLMKKMSENLNQIAPKYTFLKRIGSGAFGVVFEAEDDHKRRVAFKRIHKVGNVTSREIEILLQIKDFTNVVKLLVHKVILTLRIFSTPSFQQDRSSRIWFSSTCQIIWNQKFNDISKNARTLLIFKSNLTYTKFSRV
jgi:serine/threonine protein kinase